MKNFLNMLILIALTAELIDAQSIKRIAGQVSDEEGKRIPFVNVFIKDTFDGAMSGDKGDFIFETNKTDTVVLLASMVGYERYEKSLVLNSHEDINIKIVMISESIQMQETIVTGSSFSSEKEKGIVVTPMDIYTTPGGAADIYQSLKTMPGVTQVSESAELYVRGGDPFETVTLIDQASVYHPFTYESAYGGLFSNLNTSSFKGLYFSSGGFSAKYGNVLSGVLDIQTKDEPQSSGFSLGISMAAVSLNGEIPLVENKTGIRFYSQQSFTKPIMWLNGNLDRFTVTPRSRNFLLSSILKYSETGRVKILGLYSEDKQGVSIKRAEFNGMFDGNSENKFINLQNTDILYKNIFVKNSISFNSYSNKWKLGILDLLKTDEVIKFRTDLEWTASKNSKLLFGGEFENRTEKYKGIIPAEDYDYRPEANGEVINSKLFGQRIGMYAELEKADLLNLENLFVITGIRGDFIPQLNLAWIDPRFGIGYKINENSSVKFGFGLFHQLPSSRLFSSSDGNPDLKPMGAIHYVTSYDISLNNENSLRVEAYYKKYLDLPLKNETVNYDNLGFGYAKGVDIILKGNLSNEIDGWISYGFIDTKRKWMDFEELTNSSYDITHNFTAVAKYRVSAFWQLGINYKYATGKPYNPIIGSKYKSDLNIYEPVYGPDNSQRYPDYQRLDLRLTFLNQIFDKYFTVVYLEGLNILNISNLFGYSYNEDYTQKSEIDSYFGRRTIVVGAQINF